MKERDKPARPDLAAKDLKPGKDSKVQGEGDYAADRRYRERTDDFLKTADVEEVARAAAPKSEAEARELAAAEKEGRSHAVPVKTKQGKKAPDGPQGR